MGETVKHTTAQGNAIMITAVSQIKYLDGSMLDAWDVEPVWDTAYDRSTLSGYGLGRRQFSLRFVIKATTYDNVRGTIAAIRAFVLEDVSRVVSGIDPAAMGTVEIVLDNGGTYTTRAAIRTPSISGPHNVLAELVLGFESDEMLWTYGAEQSALGTFDGTTPVNVAFNNTGDFFSRPHYLVVGSVDTLRLTDVESGDYIEIGTVTAANDDELHIYTDPPRIDYVAGGTAPVANWTGFAGTVSKFPPLQASAGTVQLSAAGGTAIVTTYWDVRVGGLGI